MWRYNMSSLIPSERLRVFISSAQNDENGFSWLETRKRIKKHLGSCPYLNPFIIEDSASAKRSEQFYQRQVEKSDLVVLLVKGDVRKGTQIEFALCSKLRKPLYVYFLKDTCPSLSVEKIKKDIQSRDLCTYKQIDNFDHIEEIVRNDILEDVIRYYQDGTHINTYFVDESEDLSLSIKSATTGLSIPSKTSLVLFQSCYNYIYELLNIFPLNYDSATEKSEFHELGKLLIDWLINGDLFDCDNEILKLVESTKSIYNNTDWLMYRWDAIKYELRGDSNNAYEFEQKALILAKKSNFPQWIINNILIDCRNIEAEIEYKNGGFPMSHNAQKELDLQESIVCLPVVDRYQNQIYNEIISEEHLIFTASYNSMTFSNRLNYAIRDAVNYFFASVLYGSYTHIVEARNILSHILYKFGKFQNISKLTFESIKLEVINGNCKNFKSMLLTYWDDIYLYVAPQADEIWNTAQNAIFSRRDSMKLAVMDTVGLYLSDDYFVKAETFLYSYVEEVYWGNSEDFFSCILANIARLDQNRLVCALSDIITKRKFHLGGTLSKIIMHLRLDSVIVENLYKVKNALMEQLQYIIENNGNPQFISVLVRHNQEIFGELEALPNNGLVGLERMLYEINMGSNNWTPILEEEIKFARKQFEDNKTKGVYVGNGYSFYDAISNIVRKPHIASVEGITSMICEQFIPLSVEILNSNVDILIKGKCVECLCDVLSFLLYQNIKVTNDMVSAIQNVNFTQSGSLLSLKSETSFYIKALMIKLIVGLADKNDLLSSCVEYNKRPTAERVALANCLEKYLYRNAKLSLTVDVLLVTLIVQCCDDEYYEIRAIGCKCVSYILNSNFREILENKLYQHAMDSSAYVRNCILLLCKSGDIIDEVSEKLIVIFKNDANYTIRQRALLYNNAQ